MEALPIITPPEPGKTPQITIFSQSFLYVYHTTSGGFTLIIDRIPFAISNGTFVGFYYTGSQVTRTVGSLTYTIYPPGAMTGGYDETKVYVVLRVTYPGDVWLFTISDKLWA